MPASSPHDRIAPYALGALGEPARRAFEQHLGRCRRCRWELRQLAEVAAVLAYGADPIEPPVGLRERILELVDSEPQERAVGRARRVPVHRLWAGLAGAAAVAVVASGALAISHSLARESSLRSSEGGALALLARADTRRLPLRGGNGVLAIGSRGTAVLIVPRLARAPRGRTYQAWLIRGDRASSAGLFAGGGAVSLVRLPERLAPGTIVAVSLERAGGARLPQGGLLFAAVVDRAGCSSGSLRSPPAIA